jgi:hypothetical protein
MTVFKRFPSYDQIARGAAATVKRFPFALLSAAVGSVVAIYVVGHDHPADFPALEKVITCAALGIPFFTALVTFAEKRGWNEARKMLLQGVGLALLVGYYFSLPAKISEPMHHLVRFALLNIGLHFLVAWLPWTGKDQLVGFWQYNKTLFLRFLTTALFSAVLYVGLALALLAADQLFGAEVKEERYFQLWILIAGLFNTWVFLAGVPKDLEALNRGGEYPNGLKVFTQFILLPLVFLYFAILITYEAKIIIDWNWPKGWVSELVLWYSVVGILSLLLLHPLRDRLESRWIQATSKWFYRGMIPLVGMLFLAILRRISEYGVTENRYLVLGMAAGLTVVMLYMIISRRKDIRLIPILICLLAFFSAYGPWSAFAISRTSQHDRLERLMVSSGLLVNGVLAQPEVEPPVETLQEMSGAVIYLDEFHGMDAFSDWLADSTRQTLDTLPRNDRAGRITDKLGFACVSPPPTIEGGRYRQLRIGDLHQIDIGGYDVMFRFEDLSASDSIRVFPFEHDTCRLAFDTSNVRLTLQFRGVSYDSGAVTVISLKDRFPALVEKRTTDKLSPEDLSFSAEDADTSAKVVLRSAWVGGDGLNVNSLNGYLLLRRHK